jgi:carbon storage regulator
MLVLSRKVGEEIVIGEDIRVVVVATHNNRVRLGLTAPAEVSIQRNEIYLARKSASDRFLQRKAPTRPSSENC